MATKGLKFHDFKWFPSMLNVADIVRKEEEIGKKQADENEAIWDAKAFYIHDKIAGLLAEMAELGIDSLQYQGETILEVKVTDIPEIKLIPKRF